VFAGQTWGAAAARYTVDSELIGEASGVAVSRHNPELLWVHNDSGSLPVLYAITTHGRYLGQVDINVSQAVDWEDIAAFKLDGKAYLLIADTGDNFGFRASVSLYLLPEPDITQARKHFSLMPKTARRIDITYPDHGHDVEAVAVDAGARTIYLLSKRDKPPVLYEVPLAVPEDEQSVTARPVTEINTLVSAAAPTAGDNPKVGDYRHRPSALDISADGRQWLISTATGGYLYTRKSGQSPAQMLAGQPMPIPVSDLRQLEAGALSPDNRFAYFMSEKLPTPLVVRRLDQTEH